MEATTAHLHDVHEVHHEHEMSFLQKYVFSTDHKIIGIQYGVTALFFLLFGFSLMMLMRWQIAYPGHAIPVIGGILQKALGTEMLTNQILENGAKIPGVMTSDFYNALGAMHGTIMVFLAIVPLAFAAFGNLIVPLQIGAVDMAFPRVNMVSYQVYFLGGVIMLTSFFIPGGAAQAGWTSSSCLSASSPTDGTN